LPARLLLQVHDELVLECDPDVEATVSRLVVQTMEQAVTLRVPLQVEIAAGPNWMEAKG
jgi:DNA polymerase-1